MNTYEVFLKDGTLRKFQAAAVVIGREHGVVTFYDQNDKVIGGLQLDQVSFFCKAP